MGPARLLVDAVGPLPVPRPTVSMASMPSPGTLQRLVTGPSNAPADGQSISAPLPHPRREPLTVPMASPPSPALPVSPPTVPVTSMPSISTLHTSLTGPSNVPEDGQTVSAPVARQRRGPLSYQRGELVHTRRASKRSGDTPK
jgi:hypothetical protein